MDDYDIWQEMNERLPIKWTANQPLHEELKETFDALRSFMNIRSEFWSGTITQTDIANISHICNDLVEIQRYETIGQRSTAYNKLKSLLDEYLDKYGILTTIEAGHRFYRMRLSPYPNRKRFPAKEMFHIPMELRGKIKTQRFSAPGYPCLYLGESIYTCWEEMNNPLLNDCMVSCVRSELEFRALDIRIPDSEEFLADLKKSLYRLPLIIACMVEVNEKDSDYKPEYTIPQLLMEYIINHNNEESNAGRENYIYGVYYTSTHRNPDFNYPNDKFYNLAIPVLSPLKIKGLCPKLTQLFTITDSTYAEYQHLLNGYPSPWIELDGKSTEQQIEYSASEFNFLESNLGKDKWAFNSLYNYDEEHSES